MPSKKDKTPIIPGYTYHIFNRGNNYEKVFFTENDYQLFLKKFSLYLKNVSEIYAYALLPNHYHFLLKVNENINEYEFSNQFQKFILSYTYIINKRENRSGNLFLKNFKRLIVENDDYFNRLIFYIHYNPEGHEICNNFRKYKYSSYQALISSKKTLLARNYVIELFNTTEEFINLHDSIYDETVIEKLILE